MRAATIVLAVLVGLIVLMAIVSEILDNWGVPYWQGVHVARRALY
jgi:hypothetical protein